MVTTDVETRLFLDVNAIIDFPDIEENVEKEIFMLQNSVDCTPYYVNSGT
jgi:hypothetical protein